MVGHADSVGQFDANMKLSQARAEAVITVLRQAGGRALLEATGSPRSQPCGGATRVRNTGQWRLSP